MTFSILQQPTLLSGFRQRRYCITKTAIPFSVCVAFNFHRV